MPILPVGKVGFRKGLYMASTDEIYMTIKGKGGHGAQPQANIDPIVAMAQVITAFNR
jgi:metal-dependent amidase/aminoacylase/carboxypeptidase family protein